MSEEAEDYMFVIPQTPDELEGFKNYMQETWGIKDDPKVWYTIYSHMAGLKPTELEVDVRDLAAIARRLEINKFLQDQKVIEHQKIIAMLAEEAKKNEPAVQDGTPDLQADVPELPGSSDRVVPVPPSPN